MKRPTRLIHNPRCDTCGALARVLAYAKRPNKGKHLACGRHAPPFKHEGNYEYFNLVPWKAEKIHRFGYAPDMQLSAELEAERRANRNYYVAELPKKPWEREAANG